MLTTLRSSLAAAVVIAAASHPARSEPLQDADGREIAARVRNLFLDHCAACHTPGSREYAGVRYDGDIEDLLDFQALRQSEWIDLETPEDSELYLIVRDGDMPHPRAVRAGLARELTAAETAWILAWIRAGAPDAPEARSRIDFADGDAASPLSPATGASSREEPAPVVLDPQTVQEGRVAFEQLCTKCHDANRALDKTKSYEGWLRTVRRMSRKQGAEIRAADVEPIVAYLTSRSRESEGEDGPLEPAGSFLDSIEINATISTLFRGSAREDVLENEGFLPEAWVGIEWHPEGSPFGARVTACITCHSSSEPEGNRLELVEAAFRLDVTEVFDVPDEGPRVSVDVGRLIVPFGAFAAQSHPGAFRTVTRPLLYNMGQLVNRDDIGPAILPMPYSDEGILVNADVPLAPDLPADLSATFDAYVVNGLQGDVDVNFFESRDYTDNNTDPAVGGRVTVGTPFVRVGSSATAGRLDEDGNADKRLQYEIIGVDVTGRFRDRFRVQAEYARRKNDQMTFLPADPRGEARVDGYSVEGDVLLHREHGLSFVARYDSLLYDGDVPPPRSSLDGDFNVARVTWGFNLALPFGSTLMLNHEHWSMPGGLDSVDVIGVRWVASF